MRLKLLSPLQVLLIKPPRFVHVESAREAIEVLHFGFGDLGLSLPVSENRLLSGHVPIVFGADLLGSDERARLPKESIMFNLEQFDEGYVGAAPGYLDMLSSYLVWDYRARNVRTLQSLRSIARVMHVPLGYVTQLTREVSVAKEDVDILFYGVITPRRLRIIEVLQAKGLNVVALNGVFGAARNHWIARAKVVLNVHQVEGGDTEVPRLLYLLANRKAVVSEISDRGDDTGLEAGTYAVPFDGLVNGCLELLADPEARARMARTGFALVTASSLQASRFLRQALDDSGLVSLITAE